MAGEMWREVGRGLTQLGTDLPKQYYDYEDRQFQGKQRQLQLDDFIQKRIEAQDAQQRAKIEQQRKDEAYKREQERLKAEEATRQKELKERERRNEIAMREVDKIARKYETVSNEFADKALKAGITPPNQDAAYFGYDTPQAPTTPAQPQAPTPQAPSGAPQQPQDGDYGINISGGNGASSERDILDQESAASLERFNRGTLDELEAIGEPQDMAPPEWDLKRRNDELYFSGAIDQNEYTKREQDRIDREPGGRYGKKSLTFEDRAALEILREDLRAGRPLTEWQRQLLELRKDEFGLKKEGLGLRKESLQLSKEDQKKQEAGRLTSFVKNTKEQAEVLYAFQNLDRIIPEGIYGQAGIAGYGFGTKPFRKFWKSDEANAIRPGLQSLINKVLKQRSGAAVTEQELQRLEQEFGINTTGTLAEFRQGLQNFYEGVKNDYDRFVQADPESAQQIDRSGYGQIANTPKRVHEQRPQAQNTTKNGTKPSVADLRARYKY